MPYIEWNYLDLADITVVFENTFTEFLDATTFYALKALSTTYDHPKSAFAIMLHSIPQIPDELVAWMVDQLKDMTEWNFLSSIGEPGEYWHSFSPVFEEFVQTYARAA